ncbi:MAG: FAD:protein FMN transferase [Pirellulales bacterium]|nr:FAD:protein FMN transferase [Pirellulales bacterium]
MTREASDKTRRDFLVGGARRDGARPSAGEDTPSDPQQPGALLQVGRSAMACQWEVYLNAGQYEQAQAAAIDALDVVEELEAQMTVYNDLSELSHINFDAAESPMDVEPRLFKLLQQSLNLSDATDGAFDITAGPLSKLWGFFRRDGRIPDEQALQDCLATVGSKHVDLDANDSTVAFTRRGVELNLGAIGKGYALDRCAESLVESGVDDFLIHGGQSSILARGQRAGQPSGWVVGIRHPLRPERRLVEIVLHDRALGTSGTAAQSFFHQGRRYGHILDPRSGMPADGMLSTTVVAPTAAEADALATAFYVMGHEASLAFLDDRPDLAAILAMPGDRQGSMQLEIVGFEDENLLNLVE